MNQRSEKEEAILRNKQKSLVNKYKDLVVQQLTGEITHREFIEKGRELGYDMDEQEQFYKRQGYITEGS